MSRISRRSLLGYSGTAAAGAVLASAGTAEAGESDQGNAADQTKAAADTPAAGEFWGSTSIGDIDANMDLRFTLRLDNTPDANTVSPLDIAEALNELATARGWPPITFYYTPAPVPLN